MSNRNCRSANKKKRHKYKKGGLCPKCKKGHLVGCDQQKKGHRHHLACTVCKDCNY